MKPLITVFTTTYNRGYIIPKLYYSLCNQTSKNFEWLVVDDGSVDDTKEIIQQYINENNDFDINYFYKRNEGKPCAINDGLKLAKGRYFFMVDSDDFLKENAIEKMEKWIEEIDLNETIVAVGAAKGYPNNTYIKGCPPKVNNKGYIDATNLERKNYDLDADMCEAYKIHILKRYPFVVWKNEKFAPEEIVLNDMALDGYKVRWHKDIIYICDYLEDGLTKGHFDLLRKNPMGYAMLYNNKLKYSKGFKEKIYNSAQMIALSIIGKNFNYVFNSYDKISTFIALPIGLVITIRRRIQFSHD